MKKYTLIGPFFQVVPMTGLPLKGAISDTQNQILPEAGILIKNDTIEAVGNFTELLSKYEDAHLIKLNGQYVCLPGLIDAHTHICYGGSRANDYAMRNAGKTYLEISKSGGGIWDTVTETRKLSMEELAQKTIERANHHLKNGITTLEVKSGYGLSVEEELKMLRAIKKANTITAPDLVSTCLAAHMVPKDYHGTAEAYLNKISTVLFPKLQEENLTNRIDAFIEENAFSKSQIAPYFEKAHDLGFDITVHADQFSTGGSEVAVNHEAISADHLEASTDKEIALLAKSNVIAMALPGASLGLGCAFTPARKILDAGGSLAIASDHNPGSAPMGYLLAQAAMLGAFQKLTNTEVLAGITYRAAAALNLKDRGKINTGMLADLCVFNTNNYNEILYNQGSLKPCMVWKNGTLVFDKQKN
ncbi:imidazolonepropionase [Saonia flava]|uniref:Imidazolonepropionase n=1 Tax=Saonia flava TaxID=523696 RepID=A0A846QSN1_9FLAO|nr:imidazolonepropionase [Saonia flava]NJB71068.1 imidazolonepropionase [Saonia flava]